MSALYLSRWTFVGVQCFPGVRLLLINDEQGSTRTLCVYSAAHPVRILEAQ